MGANRTEDSMVIETEERICISQRLTPTNSCLMVWAKLLGSSIAPWYAGIFYLINFFDAGIRLELETLQWVLVSQGLIPGALYLIGVNLVCQVLGFMIGIGATEERSSSGSRRTFCANIDKTIKGTTCITLCFKRLEPNSLINWYGIPFAEFNFWFFSLYAYLAWGLIGLNAQMRKEFQVQNYPLVWVSFLAFIILYISGFEFAFAIKEFGEKGPIFFRSMLSFLSMPTLTYLTIVWEKTGGFALRQLFSLIKRREIKKAAFENTPVDDFDPRRGGNWN